MAEIVEISISEPQTEVAHARASIIADIAGQGAGKTMNIGILVGWMVTQYPEAKGFIGANSYLQLSQSTMTAVFRDLERYYGLTEYDAKTNPGGHYVIDKKPPRHFVSLYKFKNYSNVLTFWNGATVFLGSLDNYKMHEGKEFAWAHLDETKNTKKEALTHVIIARLRQYGLWTNGEDVFWAPRCSAEVAKRQGWKAWAPLYIHTSPAEGGDDWLVEFLGIGNHEEKIRETLKDPNDFVCMEIDNKRVVIYSTYHNEHNLRPGFIEDRLRDLSEGEADKMVYGNPFSKSGGEWYPKYNSRIHVRPVAFEPGKPVFQAWDFNTMPYVTLLLAHVEYVTQWWSDSLKKRFYEKTPDCREVEVLQIRFFDEICMEPPRNSTEEAALEFLERYGDECGEVYAFGDASGRNRIVGLGSLTQYKIIERILESKVYLPTGWLKAKPANMLVGMRRDLMNRIWENKIPEMEIIIDPKCEKLRKDNEFLKQSGKGTSEKHKEYVEDPATGIKYQKLGHCSDAEEYLCCELGRDFIKNR